jgi:hypothetical protein
MLGRAVASLGMRGIMRRSFGGMFGGFLANGQTCRKAPGRQGAPSDNKR